MSSKKKAAGDTPATQTEGGLVKVTHHGKGMGRLIHGEHSIGAGETVAVPKEVADLWMTHTHAGDQLIRPAGETVADKAVKGEVLSLNGKLSAADKKIANLEKLLAELQEGKGRKPKPAPAPKEESAPPADAPSGS